MTTGVFLLDAVTRVVTLAAPRKSGSPPSGLPPFDFLARREDFLATEETQRGEPATQSEKTVGTLILADRR